MEYIKYLMVQKLNGVGDINGYSWLKKRINEAPPDPKNQNNMHLVNRIIPFDEEYNDILKRYQSGLNTMERTISSLLNFKLQVISGDNSLKIPENISSEEFIRARNKLITHYQSLEEAHSDGAFRYLEGNATSSVKISGEDGAFGTPPPRVQSQTPSPKKQATPTTALRKAGKAGKVKRDQVRKVEIVKRTQVRKVRIVKRAQVRKVEIVKRAQVRKAGIVKRAQVRNSPILIKWKIIKKL